MTSPIATTEWDAIIRELEVVEAFRRNPNMPRQKRSRDSLDRMMAATKTLMLRHGSEEFTLIDVGQEGAVSTGSIYLRFSSKENLIRAVMVRWLEDFAALEQAMLAGLERRSGDLASFMIQFVENYAELLRADAPLMSLSMERAAHDPFMSLRGKGQADGTARSVVAAILRFAGEIGGDRHEQKANMTYRMIFSALARELGLGSTAESAHPLDWATFKRELATVCVTYLKHAE